MPGLTPKREAFCREYLVDQNATQAAMRAGYSEATAQQQGSRLLLNVMVQARVAELQSDIAERNEVTVDSIVAELEEARSQAVALGQASAAVAASMGKAKVCGLLIDRYRDESQRQSDADLIRTLAGGDPMMTAVLIMKFVGGGPETDEVISQLAGDDEKQEAAIRAALAQLDGGTRH